MPGGAGGRGQDYSPQSRVSAWALGMSTREYTAAKWSRLIRNTFLQTMSCRCPRAPGLSRPPPPPPQPPPAVRRREGRPRGGEWAAPDARVRAGAPPHRARARGERAGLGEASGRVWTEERPLLRLPLPESPRPESRRQVSAPPPPSLPPGGGPRPNRPPSPPAGRVGERAGRG